MLGSTIDSSGDVDARDAIGFLEIMGYGDVLVAAQATLTASGRLNKSAISRQLKMMPETVRRRLDEMRDLIER